MWTRRNTCRTLCALVAALLFAPEFARSEPAFSRTFNGPELAWGILDNGNPSKVLAHDCIPGGARDNSGIERTLIAATAGQSVLLGCPIPPIAAVDELKIRLWVKSLRPDIQLAARIALPRSLDPSGRGPATAIVKGTPYTRPGHWQELVLIDVPKLLAAQVRVMRTTPGTAIDSREAYLDSVVLIIPGDPKGVEVGTDQLEVEGVQIDPTRVAKPEAKSDAPNTAPAPRSPLTAADKLKLPAPAIRPHPADQPAVSIRLQGSMLLVDNRPFFPRAVEWHGEPLQFLADRGFNAVKLPAPPTDEQIDEAKQLMLWFICIPPRPEAIAQNGLGARNDRVVAWSLEDEAIAADPNYAIRWADTIREHDAVYGRPIVVAPDSTWRMAGKCGDILLAYHPRGSRLTDAQYAAWLAARPRLARPGTPTWAAIDTQFSEGIRQQLAVLTHQKQLPAPTVDAEQLELLLQTATISSVRGLVFRSNSSLAEADPSTRARAALLERLNRRLQFMEPWLAGGKVVSRASSTDGRYDGIVLHVDRARLLIPFEAAGDKPATSARPPAPAKEITFIVPGVSESSQAYYITPVALTAAATSRVAGGTRFTIPAASDGLVVLTEDPQVIQAIRQKITRQAPQLARLERDFIVGRAQAIFETDRRLAPLNLKPTVSATDATLMNTRLAQLDTFLAAGQLDRAQDHMSDLLAEVRRTSTEQRNTVGLTNGLSSDALGLTYERLAESAALERSFENLRGGENLVDAGDFEDLAAMTRVGWQHVVSPTANAASAAELSNAQPQSGNYCLQLRAGPSPDAPAPDVAEPRVWIISPAIPLEAEKTVEITGWIRVDEPFATPGEGLAIIDTLGGPELSVVASQTSGWQMFRLIRATSLPTNLRVTFALTGNGSAKVDAIMVRTLQQPIARRLPTVNRIGDGLNPRAAELPTALPGTLRTR